MKIALLFKRPILFLSGILLTGYYCIATPTADSTIIRSHLLQLTTSFVYRSHHQLPVLNKTADYIRSVFARYADTVYFQEFIVNGEVYKNVICSYGMANPKRIVIGAHYDVCQYQQGADDNASGVTGLLELARMLKGQPLRYRIDLVAFTLEEPPYFRSTNMGSYVHAKSLVDDKADVYGMISLEMIGYFKDEKKTQTYPAGILSLVYGNRGNYITLVKKLGAGKFARQFCKQYIQSGAIRTKKFSGPKSLPGIDFSDHLNYWKFDYSALMITDTSFYRNKNYHEVTDTIDTLDITRMTKVIDGVFQALIAM